MLCERRGGISLQPYAPLCVSVFVLDSFSKQEYFTFCFGVLLLLWSQYDKLLNRNRNFFITLLCLSHRSPPTTPKACLVLMGSARVLPCTRRHRRFYRRFGSPSRVSMRHLRGRNPIARGPLSILWSPQMTEFQLTPPSQRLSPIRLLLPRPS